MTQKKNKLGSILLAEHDKIYQQSLKTILSDAGYNVSVVEDGQALLERFNYTQFDLLLMDVNLPLKDGFYILDYIREELNLKLFPVIIITSEEDVSDLVRAFDLGASDFLLKSLLKQEILARVDAQLRKKNILDHMDNSEAVLFALARLIEARDSETGDHCDRLAHMSIYFGQSLELPLEDLEALWKGSILHDIGKIIIPDRILLKPDRLSESEWEVMKRHVITSKKLCEPLVSLKKAMDIIVNHHEHWNGSGYPRGLRGEEIPYLARVFQLVDVYDALRSKRPYRKSLSKEETINIMKKETEEGKWDPFLMDKFLTLVKEHGDKLETIQYIEDESLKVFSEIKGTEELQH